MVNSTTKNASLSEDFSIVFFFFCQPISLALNMPMALLGAMLYIDGCGCVTVKSRI